MNKLKVKKPHPAAIVPDEGYDASEVEEADRLIVEACSAAHITLCLGHDVGSDRPGCPKSEFCERHLALRARKFPKEAPLVGTVCSTADYMLFLPVGWRDDARQ